MQKQIQEAIKKGMEKGESIEEINARVQQVFEENAQEMAKAIQRFIDAFMWDANQHKNALPEYEIKRIRGEGPNKPPEPAKVCEVNITDETPPVNPVQYKNPVISIKPKYAELIYSGEKTVELRKCRPNDDYEGAYLYETSPVKELTGIIKYGSIMKAKLDILWDHVKDKACVSRKEFDEYYEGHKTGVGIFIDDYAQTGRMKAPLDILRSIYGFHPPQSIGYIKLLYPFDFQKLKSYYNRVNGVVKDGPEC